MSGTRSSLWSNAGLGSDFARGDTVHRQASANAKRCSLCKLWHRSRQTRSCRASRLFAPKLRACERLPYGATFRSHGHRKSGRLSNMQDHELSASLSGTVTLGKELTVHRLGFGAMRITGNGVWGAPKDPNEAVRVLRRAVELGVNFIDTADSYGPDVSEELIAEALAPYPKGVVVATKGGWRRPGRGQWTHDASPQHLREAVEGSLKKLRLKQIDLYQLHIPDPVIPFEQSVETLAQLRNQGLIRLIGLSNVTQEH